MKKKQLIFIGIFTILGLIALQIPFTRLLGSNVKFTLFDFLATTAGAFLGTSVGIISVLLMQLVNLVVHGSKFDTGGLIRLFPTLFAVAYFAKKRTLNIIVPIIAMIGFNLHPIGRSAWIYSLFWLIPILAHFWRKNLFAKSLGATFTAHAVGGVLWVWAFGLTRQIWLALIPQVIMERILMAVGISAFYLLFSKVLNYASRHHFSTNFLKALRLN
ncbi:hypothetical protein A2960_05915 [Candidatus Gottesmanbacteria bacterium RIFCSPLOWO2_01_FULL_39_12b]|uniref:ECF transporter S component n=1 Tax=Candidatus Gottesmanbacteria bacterium RIFCSPLOWO2_01_FULL_39_12b TaxID=1798388 RepID=A0A1F6AN00_9BACT|nr:MAG: hypothetical protein A2960_05915 [Candidatus Gottesmanbacteria bacterium RIFCSPLOWO2_01_FULL_39_12b]